MRGVTRDHHNQDVTDSQAVMGSAGARPANDGRSRPATVDTQRRHLHSSQTRTRTAFQPFTRPAKPTSKTQLTQMKPVAARAAFCVKESLSAGRPRSLIPAMTRAHFATGAQKKIVLLL